MLSQIRLAGSSVDGVDNTSHPHTLWVFAFLCVSIYECPTYQNLFHSSQVNMLPEIQHQLCRKEGLCQIIRRFPGNLSFVSLCINMRAMQASLAETNWQDEISHQHIKLLCLSIPLSQIYQNPQDFAIGKNSIIRNAGITLILFFLVLPYDFPDDYSFPSYMFAFKITAVLF